MAALEGFSDAEFESKAQGLFEKDALSRSGCASFAIMAPKERARGICDMAFPILSWVPGLPA